MLQNISDVTPNTKLSAAHILYIHLKSYDVNELLIVNFALFNIYFFI
jgi:hypothetical protein